VPITLYGSIRPVGQYDAESTPIEAAGADYDTAKAALEQQVPDGWQLLGIGHWPA